MPENIDTVKKFINFIKDLLKEKKKTNKRNLENIFENLQNKATHVMGPLAKLWKIPQERKTSPG